MHTYVLSSMYLQEVTPLVSTDGDAASSFSGDRRSLEARALVAERAQRANKKNTKSAGGTPDKSTSGEASSSLSSSPSSVSSMDGHTAARSEELDAYCELQSGREPLILESLRLETMAKMPRAAHMVSLMGVDQSQSIYCIHRRCSVKHAENYLCAHAHSL